MRGAFWCLDLGFVNFDALAGWRSVSTSLNALVP